MIRRLFSLLALGLVLFAPPASAGDGPEAEALVRQAVEDASATFAGGPFSREESGAKVAGLVSRYADIAYESELILGRHWRKATPDQRETFTGLLIPFFVATYAEMIDGPPGSVKVETLGVEERQDGVLVKARMILSPTESVPLSFIVQRAPSSRLVITDVIAEGAGLLTTIRSDFTSVIRSGGGDIETLFKAMRAKIKATQPKG